MMRQTPPRLINPMVLGERHLLDRLGGTTLSELRRADAIRQTFGDPRPRKRPAIRGVRENDDASDHLVRELVARGLVRDRTFSEGAG